MSLIISLPDLQVKSRLKRVICYSSVCVSGYLLPAGCDGGRKQSSEIVPSHQ